VLRSLLVHEFGVTLVCPPYGHNHPVQASQVRTSCAFGTLWQYPPGHPAPVTAVQFMVRCLPEIRI